MKISQTGSGAPANRSRKADKSVDGRKGEVFKGQLGNEPLPSLSGPTGAAPLAALSSLLAVQEVPDQTSDRKRAVMHGDTLLDELQDLQIGLVQGWVSEDSLRSITHMLDGSRPAIDDPALNQILNDIEVRAAVELAKLEKSRPKETTG